MVINDAPSFIAQYRESFSNDVVRQWGWQDDDADFGKTHHWIVRAASADGTEAEVSASVELQLDQLQLVVSERYPNLGADTQLVLNALIVFDPPALYIDGLETGFSESAIEHVLSEFNEKVAI